MKSISSTAQPHLSRLLIPHSHVQPLRPQPHCSNNRLTLTNPDGPAIASVGACPFPTQQTQRAPAGDVPGSACLIFSLSRSRSTVVLASSRQVCLLSCPLANVGASQPRQSPTDYHILGLLSIRLPSPLISSTLHPPPSTFLLVYNNNNKRPSIDSSRAHTTYRSQHVVHGRRRVLNGWQPPEPVPEARSG